MENIDFTEKELSLRLKNSAELYYHSTIDSTNSEARRLINAGKKPPFLVAANSQTAGRGRHGKSFYSPGNTGIYMSYTIAPPVVLGSAEYITTAAAVAVCRAIESLTNANPKIKWVNDLYLNGKKICGILTEAVTDFKTGELCAIIIGIGINITTTGFPKEIENAASLDIPVNRAELFAKIVDEIDKISNQCYNDFIDYYKSRSMLLGQKISFTQNGKLFYAKVLDINEKCRLVVKLQNGETKALDSGEISLRKD